MIQHHEISDKAKEAGMSVMQLAERLNTSRQYLHQMQTGARPAPESWLRRIEAAISTAKTLKRMNEAAWAEIK